MGFNLTYYDGRRNRRREQGWRFVFRMIVFAVVVATVIILFRVPSG
jgi:hypothetical protein